MRELLFSKYFPWFSFKPARGFSLKAWSLILDLSQLLLSLLSPSVPLKSWRGSKLLWKAACDARKTSQGD